MPTLQQFWGYIVFSIILTVVLSLIGELSFFEKIVTVVLILHVLGKNVKS